MAKAVAFLRAVNVGGTGKLSMADLEAFAEDLGLAEARTLLNSGNLLFEAGRKSPTALETLLEKEADARLGLKIEFMVRGAERIADVLSRNPFPKEAKSDPGHLHVHFLKGSVTAKEVAALNAAIKGRESVKGVGREVFISFPDGSGNSKLTGAVIERHLGTRSTGRNWNTVNKLATLLAE